MIATYVFTIKEVPASNNAKGGGMRANKFEAHREKKKWEGLYLMEMMVLRVPRPMLHCAVTVQLHFKHKAGKGRDEENYRQPVIKPLGDALQQGGYLANDTREFFEVCDLRLIEGERPWPASPLPIKSYMTVALTGTYHDD